MHPWINKAALKFQRNILIELHNIHWYSHPVVAIMRANVQLYHSVKFELGTL